MKLKDLTIEQLQRFCAKQPNCTKCPLNAKYVDCYFMYRNSKDQWIKEENKEIKL